MTNYNLDSYRNFTEVMGDGVAGTGVSCYSNKWCEMTSLVQNREQTQIKNNCGDN